MRFTRQSKKVTRNVLKEGTDPRGRTYYWLSEQQVIDEVDPRAITRPFSTGRFGDTARTGPHARASLNHLSHWAKLLERRRISSRREPAATDTPV